MEQHILVPGLKESEMIKNLALHGRKSFNLHIYSALGLAKEALLRQGIRIRESLIAPEEEKAFILQALQVTEFFGNASYADVQKIAAAIRSMREMTATEDEEDYIRSCLEKGDFQEKNQALFAVYERYIQLLREHNKIDSIGVIRRAVLACEPWKAPIEILQGVPLVPLYYALAETLSGGKPRSLSILDLYQTTKKQIQIADIKMCYGMANEVETVLQAVYGQPALDRCTIALTDYRAYSQLLYDYSITHTIPMTFGKGISIINASPARLLRKYQHWMVDGFFGADVMRAMVQSPEFCYEKLLEQFLVVPETFDYDLFWTIAGNIRFTNIQAENDKKVENFAVAAARERDADLREKKMQCLPYLRVLAAELALPIDAFIEKYARIRDIEKEASGFKALDLEAVSVITKTIRAVSQMIREASMDDIFENIYAEMIGAQSAQAGAIHVSDIPGSLSCIREELYIMGLAASKYPKYQPENFLLLDEDIRKFGSQAELLLSDQKTIQKRKDLLQLADLAAALGTEVHISYAGLNVSELKNDNASSLIYELCSREKGTTVTEEELEARIEKIRYFDPEISANRRIGQAYTEGKRITAISGVERKEAEEENKCYSVDELAETLAEAERTWAGSAFEVVPDIDMEQLLHTLAAACVGSGSGLQWETYRQTANDLYDQYILEHPPLIGQEIEVERTHFLRIVQKTYPYVANERAVSPAWMQIKIGEQVVLSGCPDLLLRREGGYYDFIKFEIRDWQEKADFKRLAQEKCVAYFHLLQQNGYRVRKGNIWNLSGGFNHCIDHSDNRNELTKARITAFLTNFRERCRQGGDQRWTQN